MRDDLESEFDHWPDLPSYLFGVVVGVCVGVALGWAAFRIF